LQKKIYMNQHLSEPLQKELLKIVQRESLAEWAERNEIPKTPEIKKCDTIKNNAGYYNFIRSVLNELRP